MTDVGLGEAIIIKLDMGEWELDLESMGNYILSIGLFGLS